MIPTLAARMADYAIGLRFEALSAATVHEVKRRIIDSLGCALGGWRAEPCAIARRVAGSVRSDTGATIWGTGIMTSLDWAAFANGCQVRYLDYNDTYLSKEPAHPSDNIPAAIAVAEATGATGRELIAAIVIAYELQCRLCDAASLRSIGWDHVTYGPFSTALAAARLMKLDAGRTRHALGIAGVASAALRQTRVGELSHWKGCAFASAARQGVFAAMLAREGMTGPSPIFEGDRGFERLVSGPLAITGPFASPAQVADEPMILNTSIKCWPVEYHAQSAVEASLKLRRQFDGVDSIDSILIESHDAAVDIIGSEPAKWRPENRETADHSLPYITAVALTDGQVTPEQFSPERIADQKLLSLVQRIKVARNRELSALYPQGVGNMIAITLKDGRRLVERVDYPCGHARNRMSDEQVMNKFHALAAPLISRDRADALAAYVWELDKVHNCSSLPTLLALS